MDNLRKILVDSNIFIFANINEYPEYSVAKAKLKEALEISHDRDIRINDAIIAAHAIDLKAGLFTDNIKDFEKISSLEISPLRI